MGEKIVNFIRNVSMVKLLVAFGVLLIIGGVILDDPIVIFIAVAVFIMADIWWAAPQVNHNDNWGMSVILATTGFAALVLLWNTSIIAAIATCATIGLIALFIQKRMMKE